MIKPTFAAVAVLIFVAGCVQPEVPVTEITIPGHGDQIYVFANDIREADKVKTNDPDGIKLAGNFLSRLNIVFNGSSPEDNAYFRVVLIDMVAKLPVFYAYEGRFVTFDVYYFLDDEWYNSTNEVIEKPAFTDTTVWLVGPNTGANETSLMREGSIIYLAGSSYKGLTLAGDKLTLLFFNVKVP